MKHEAVVAALSQLAMHIEALEMKIDSVYDMLCKVLEEVEGTWLTDESETEETDEEG